MFKVNMIGNSYRILGFSGFRGLLFYHYSGGVLCRHIPVQGICFTTTGWGEWVHFIIWFTKTSFLPSPDLVSLAEIAGPPLSFRGSPSTRKGPQTVLLYYMQHS
jgi:hypothetical protein